MQIGLLLCLCLPLQKGATDDEFVHYLGILAKTTSTPKDRDLALEGIRLLGMLSDARVTLLYQDMLSNRSNYSRDPVQELCTPRFFTKSNYALVVDLIARKPNEIRHLLEHAYAVRSEWWHDRGVIATLMTVLNSQYRELERLDPRFLGSEGADGSRLRGWIDMSYCLAYMGNDRYEKTWRLFLDDKRELQNLNHSSNTPGDWIPGRVCDHCFILLCIQHQADYREVLSRYTSNELIQYGARHYKEANSAAFDAAIKDFDNVMKRFFK